MFIFPDVQAAACDVVRTTLGGPVSSRWPDRPAQGHVRVWRSGGGARDVSHDVAVVTYQVWASDEAAASLRAREVQQVMHDLRNTETAHGYLTYRDEIGAPVILPDPDRAGFTYQGTVALIARITKKELTNG